MSVAEAVVRSADSQSTPEPGVGTSKQKARSASESAKRLGIDGTGIHSTDRDIASWEKKLWHYQDNLIDELTKEWNQHLYYCANHQYITWHRDQRRWMPRRTTPWRVRSVYNLTEKCLNLRVSRLTENKPAVTVQAATADREDLEKAELKEQVFWSIWNKLKLQDRWIRGRRWAGKCGIAFLKGGWDPEAGEVQPATKILPLYRSIPKDMGEPMVEQRGVLTEMPETQEIEFEEVMVGEVEQYVDRDGNALGPVMGIEITDDGEEREVRNPPPPETAYIADGEVFFDVRNAFNVRWDQYTEDIADSWYIQDAEVLPGSRVLALFPDKVEQLAKA